MKRKTGHIPILAAGLGTMLLILDSRCAADSARSALSICLETVIPGLFPMFVLSGILVSELHGASGPFMNSLEVFLGLPGGCGRLFLLGLLGGFPVGAQCIAQAVETGGLTKQEGEKMLGFCNNCSPSFLFGIAGSIFSDPFAPLLMFLIQLEAAMVLAAGTRLSGSRSGAFQETRISVSSAVSRAVRSMVTVCAWVILAGVVTGFLNRWFFPLLPRQIPQILGGLLEVTGGVLSLAGTSSEELRFLICTGLVCFGGVSVLMQIQSIAGAQGLSCVLCFRQKLIHGVLGTILAGVVSLWGPACLAVPPAILLIRKKALEKPMTSVYNNSHKGGFDHVVPKEN